MLFQIDFSMIECPKHGWIETKHFATKGCATVGTFALIILYAHKSKKQSYEQGSM